MKLEKEIAEVKGRLKDHERRISALEKIVEKKPKMISSQKKGTEDILIELKSEGFFDEGKTLSQIRDILHAKGRIVKSTDLPPYLLKLIRNNVLKRDRKVIGKKKAWVYSA